MEGGGGGGGVRLPLAASVDDGATTEEDEGAVSPAGAVAVGREKKSGGFPPRDLPSVVEVGLVRRPASGLLGREWGVGPVGKWGGAKTDGDVAARHFSSGGGGGGWACNNTTRSSVVRDGEAAAAGSGEDDERAAEGDKGIGQEEMPKEETEVEEPHETDMEGNPASGGARGRGRPVSSSGGCLGSDGGRVGVETTTTVGGFPSATRPPPSAAASSPVPSRPAPLLLLLPSLLLVRLRLLPLRLWLVVPKSASGPLVGVEILGGERQASGGPPERWACFARWVGWW